MLALTGLVMPTTVLTFLGWHVLDESQYRVERGRIASDIYTALLEFDIEKSALRKWSYRQALGQPADDAERAAFLDRMRAQIDDMTFKAELAADLDRQRGKVLEEHDDRLIMLAFLEDVVTQLDIDTRNFPAGDLAEPPLLSRIDRRFDQLRGTSFAEALGNALSAEAEALIRERERADESLAAARSLFLSAGGFGLVATVLVALILARRLRQPFRELETGLRAYAAGEFSYRFTRFRDREFIDLGSQLNAMATEVEAARGRARENRTALEQTVAARTAELRRTLDELSASEGARQKLLADIGHELRTPVTAVLGEAQVALRMKQDDPALFRAAFSRIVDVSRQMSRLIEDLLVLVRDPQRLSGIDARHTNIAEVVTPAMDVACSLARQRDISVQGPDPLPCWDLWADPDRLRQVVTCLLDNALRYSHPGGTVRLTMERRPQNTILIEVADQGIGIADSDVPRVFDRGWRADAARVHRPDGLGLGLAIARQLTEAQHGKLTLRPGDQGIGVVATLEIPTEQVVQSRND